MKIVQFMKMRMNYQYKDQNRMIYKNEIEKFKSKNQKINLTSIDNWLKENNNLLNNAIDNSVCHKWKKWRNDNTLHIFPCITNACGIRNEECRFIEFYKILLHYVQTIKSEEFYSIQLKT